MTDAVVIGGGITGLVSALRLREAGLTVTLIEASPRLGGKVETRYDDGFLLEGGPDSFVAGKGSVLGLAEDLGLADEVISIAPDAGGSYVWWDGALHPLPGGMLLMVPSRIGPLLRSDLFSWRGKTRMLADLVLPRGTGEDESLESFVVRRLGREALDRVAEPLIAGIHAAEPETMSLKASFPRFLEMERSHRSLILAARASTAPSPTPTTPSHFASFRLGMGSLVDGLLRAIDGVEIRTGVAASRMTRSGDRFRVGLDDGSPDLVTSGVVLAAPASTAARLLSDLAPGATATLAETRQVSTAGITMAFEDEDLPELSGTGFVVPPVQGRRITGVTYLSRKWAGRAPTGHSLLRVFVGGRRGQDLIRSGAETLVEVAAGEVGSMLGVTAPPLRTWVKTWPGGLHQYTMGHLDRVARAEREVSSIGAIELAGAAFHGIGLNECIDSGDRAASRLLASTAARHAGSVIGGDD